MKEFRFRKRFMASFLAICIVVCTVTGLSGFTAFAETNSFAEGELAVVNFETTWGDVDANVARMLNYIDQAHQQGVKLILFPEMCVTGYASSSDPTSEVYQMAVNNAESADGPTATTISAMADEYDMWIVYGDTEIIPDDSEHAYNSAFACSPDGEVTTYQKIAPVEGSWCTPGEDPVMLDTEWGLIGLSICYDTYAIPELTRYYAAKGCGIVLNPTATSRSYSDIDGDGVYDDIGWEYYYKNRIESITSREGILIASANLVGGDGPVRDNGKYTYNFPGGSVILGTSSTPTYYAGAVDQDIITGVSGIMSNSSSINLSRFPSSTTKVSSDFHPDYYAQWYKELSDLQESGESLKYSSSVTDGPVAAVVNCAPVWGDKQANIDMMVEYIKEAAENDVDILVFPETILTGYEYKAPEDGETEMHVALAETIPGATTNYLSQYAQEYDMYIVFGMSEKLDEPIYEDGVEKVYNSAAILSPDGTIESYQKMHRANQESQWSICGDTPYMLDTEWGKIGVDICRDGHFYPELARYYAAMGCTILIHPTATTGNAWYRETRMGSYTDRDGLAVITCNILGPDGIYDASTDTWSGGIFASTSLIITKYSANNSTSFNYETGSSLDLNGTGTDNPNATNDGTVSPEGLEIAKMNLRGCGFNITNFNPALYSKLYDELAVEYIDGYVSLYEEEEPSPNTYILTFEANDGSAIDSIEVEADTEIDLSEYKPVKDGYTFDGWYSDEDLTLPVEKVTLNADTTIYAKWTEIQYHVSYINGYEDGSFRPEQAKSRAEIAQLLYNLSDTYDISAYSTTFSDVEEGAWYYDAVMFMAEIGTVEGYQDGTFKPDQKVNRAEITALLVRFSGLTAEGTPSFDDIANDYWAVGYIAAAEKAGLINGYEDGLFRPDQSTKRAEAVKIINSMLERTPDEDTFDGYEMPFNDVDEDYWAWNEIMEAAVVHPAH